MARAAASRQKTPQEVTLEFDLFDLPTAQHKAGLAGLVMEIRSMKDRKLREDSIPSIERLTPTSVAICFSEMSAQGVFDDVYSAELVETAPQQKPRTKQDKSAIKPFKIVPLEKIDKKTGDISVVDGYVYRDVTPRLEFLEQHVPRGAHWLKLWRDMIYSVPREKPTTWKPYKVTASGKPYKEGKLSVWKKLLAVSAARKTNSVDLSEAEAGLFLGAQKTNAEQIPFTARTEHNLLLHFWPLTVLIFIPQPLNRNGEVEHRKAGYSLAVPEVADLERFCDDYPRMLDDLDPRPRGYRPAGAVIDIPAQAGLEFLESLVRLTRRSVEKKRIYESVSSVEYLHLLKTGNNTKLVASGRIVPSERLLDRYQSIVGDRSPVHRNAVFRAGLVTALLEDAPWFRSFAKSLINRPWPWFVCCEKTPQGMRSFPADAARYFRQLTNNHKEITEMTKSPDARTAAKTERPLAVLVYKLVQTYVRCKTEDRCGIAWGGLKKVKDDRGRERTNVPREYREAREKVAADVFLAMRSRREQDFVDYFTATICSVPQFISADEFRMVADSLLQEPEDVKTLTMLAISANS